MFFPFFKDYMGSSHILQVLSNLFTLAACRLLLAAWPGSFFLKPIAGVHAQRWMARDFRYFYSCIFHNYPFLAREGQTPVAANAVAPSKEGLLHRTFTPSD